MRYNCIRSFCSTLLSKGLTSVTRRVGKHHAVVTYLLRPRVPKKYNIVIDASTLQEPIFSFDLFPPVPSKTESACDVITLSDSKCF